MLALGLGCLSIAVQALNLNDLDGSNGFQVNGADASALSGVSVSGAGDVNGDGIDDVIIGAPGANVSYVVLGSGGFAANFDLVSIDGRNGFKIGCTGIASGFGWAVRGAGDVNGDGIDDMLLWVPGGPATYLLYGRLDGFPAYVDVALLDGSNGFRIIGASNVIGFPVDPASGAGDVNGDGFDDVIIGDVGADVNGLEYLGASYVVFGRSVFPASVDVALLDGDNGFRISGVEYSDASSGWAVSGAGDVNGDGIDDVIIGAPGAGDYGRSYVVFGTSAQFPASFSLASLNGNNGFRIDGVKYNDEYGEPSGYSVSRAGDINADGVDDVIIGAPGADPNGISSAGASYVVFGSRAGFPASIAVSGLDGSNGFSIYGVGVDDRSGYKVSWAGDINGDGTDDVVIGAYGADSYGVLDSGESYVIFGRSTDFAPNLDLALLDGINGFSLNGIDAEDVSGFSVSGAGDVNGDGGADLIIGAPGGDPYGVLNSGESYVVFGQPASYSPEDELEELIEEVEAIDAALAESLEKALARITDDNAKNDNGACGQLKAFVSKVSSAEREGDLTAEEAEELQQAAEDISADLDCG